MLNELITAIRTAYISLLVVSLYFIVSINEISNEVSELHEHQKNVFILNILTGFSAADDPEFQLKNPLLSHPVVRDLPIGLAIAHINSALPMSIGSEYCVFEESGELIESKVIYAYLDWEIRLHEEECYNQWDQTPDEITNIKHPILYREPFGIYEILESMNKNIGAWSEFNAYCFYGEESKEYDDEYFLGYDCNPLKFEKKLSHIILPKQTGSADEFNIKSFLAPGKAEFNRKGHTNLSQYAQLVEYESSRNERDLDGMARVHLEALLLGGNQPILSQPRIATVYLTVTHPNLNEEEVIHIHNIAHDPMFFGQINTFPIPNIRSVEYKKCNNNCPDNVDSFFVPRLDSTLLKEIGLEDFRNINNTDAYWKTLQNSSYSASDIKPKIMRYQWLKDKKYSDDISAPHIREWTKWQVKEIKDGKIDAPIINVSIPISVFFITILVIYTALLAWINYLSSKVLKMENLSYSVPWLLDAISLKISTNTIVLAFSGYFYFFIRSTLLFAIPCFILFTVIIKPLVLSYLAISQYMAFFLSAACIFLIFFSIFIVFNEVLLIKKLYRSKK